RRRAHAVSRAVDGSRTQRADASLSRSGTSRPHALAHTTSWSRMTFERYCGISGERAARILIRDRRQDQQPGPSAACGRDGERRAQRRRRLQQPSGPLREQAQVIANPHPDAEPAEILVVIELARVGADTAGQDPAQLGLDEIGIVPGPDEHGGGEGRTEDAVGFVRTTRVKAACERVAELIAQDRVHARIAVAVSESEPALWILAEPEQQHVALVR